MIVCNPHHCENKAHIIIIIYYYYYHYLGNKISILWSDLFLELV